MRQADSRQRLADEAAQELDTPLQSGFLEQRGLLGLFAGGAVVIAVVAGLVALSLTFARGGDTTVGIWSRNQPSLMVVLVLTNMLFIGYGAYQQHQIMANRRRRQHRRLYAILTVSRIMGAETDRRVIFDSITDVCRKTYECDQVSLMTLDPETTRLKVASASGHKDLTKVLGSEMQVGKGIAGWVAEHREPVILGSHVDKRQFREFEAKVHNLSAAMVVPILLRGELFGVLSVSSRRKRVRFDSEDLEALQVFAETAGICCRHVEQTSWMRQTIQRMDSELTLKAGPKRMAA